MLNKQITAYLGNIIGYFRRFINRCFHGIIYPWNNGLGIGITFYTLGKGQFNHYFSAETGFAFYGYFSTHQFYSMVHIHHS